MRRRLLAFAVLSVLATSCLAIPAFDTPARAAPAAQTAMGKHIRLVTDYPSITAKAGETVTLDFRLVNANLPPQSLKLSVQQVPDTWKAVLMGDDRPIAAAMPGTNQSVDFRLRMDIPQDAKPGSTKVIVSAVGDGVKEVLPISVTIGEVLPPRIAIEAKLPSLRGAVDSTFEYEFTVKNESTKPLTIALAAEAPAGFETSFTEQYGSQQLTAVPVEGGKSKEMKFKVDLPPGATAGSYDVAIHATAKNARADAALVLEATGKPKVYLASANQRLNASAEAGEPSQINLIVRNDGTIPAKNVELSSTPPTDWKIAFSPEKIDSIAPGAVREVVATLTPSPKTIAGDYMTTIRVSAEGSDSSSAEFRIGVTTSTLWGVFGLGIIAIALLVLVGAVVRFGRR